MSIPRYDEIFLPLLRLSENSEVSLSNATDSMSSYFNLTSEERSRLLPSNRQTVINNRVSWAKTYLVKAGLLKMTKRAHFTITERGKDVLNSGIDTIDLNFLYQFKEFQKFRNRDNDLSSSDENSDTDIPDSDFNDNSSLTPEEEIHKSLAQIEAALGDEILDKILSQSPEFFENLVVKLLVAMGYGGSFEEAGRALGKSGDGGVDGVIDQDILGLDRIYVQAKRYADGNNVSSSAIRDFSGSLEIVKASKGLFVTTSDFTQDAKTTAELISKRIVLINGRQLVKLMIRYGVGCRIEETLHIKKLDEEFFE